MIGASVLRIDFGGQEPATERSEKQDVVPEQRTVQVGGIETKMESRYQPLRRNRGIARVERFNDTDSITSAKRNRSGIRDRHNRRGRLHPMQRRLY